MIAIGSDHGGVELKDALVGELERRRLQFVDVGTNGSESVDYPDFGAAVAERVSRGTAERGVLICTNGIGMGIVANKFPGVRAAVVGDATAARMAREHNDANVLVLGGGMIGKFHGRELLNVFLDTPFGGGRHQRRVDKIAALEERLGLRREGGALR